nr:MAG TPA: hypothetical protein [Inoviridae sp.]
MILVHKFQSLFPLDIHLQGSNPKHKIRYEKC